MKKVLMLVAFVAISMAAMSQAFSVKQDVKDYINAKIIPNTTRAITPDVMKKILLGLWEFDADSIWLSGTNIKYRRGSLVFTIPFTTSSGLSDTSFLHKGLTESVWGVKNFLNYTTGLAPALSDSSNIFITSGWVKRYLAAHPFTELDPIWTAASINYYTKVQSDARFVPLTRNITINGTTHDLSIDRSWTIPVMDTMPLHNQIITKLDAGKRVNSISWAGNDSVHVLVVHFADGTSVQSSVFDRGSGGGGGSSFDTSYIYYHIDSLFNSIAEIDPVWISDSADYYTKLAVDDLLAMKVPTARTITINGTAFDLSANRSWSVGTVTNVATGFGLAGGPITATGTINFDSTAAGGFHTQPYNDIRYFGADSLHLRNTVYVSKNGNDATGLRNRLDKPFLTIQAAINAGLAGDEIIIYPGVYENANPISLSKGVNFTFIGKGEMQLNTGVSTGALFTDSAAVSTSIIKAPGWIFTARSNQYFLRLTAASNIKINFDEASSIGQHCIDIRNSSLLNITANRVHSSNSAIWTQDASSFIGNIENIEIEAVSGFGVWISNTGVFVLHSKRILDKDPTNANYLVYVAGSIATDSIYIEANQIKAATEWAVWGRGASKNVHIKAQTISANSDCVVVSGISSPGWMTVQADVIENTTTGAMDGIIHGEGGNLIVIGATLVRNASATGNDIKTSTMGGDTGYVKLVAVSYDITKVSEVAPGTVTRSDKDFYSGITGNFTAGSANDSLLVWNSSSKAIKAVNSNAFKGGSYTYTVAASNAPALLKARADYVCDGTADESEIQTALALGNVQLTEGTFYISTTGIQMPSNKNLTGVGKATILLAVGYSGSEKMITASGTTGISVRNLKIDGAGRNMGYGIFFQLVGSGAGSTAIPGALIDNIYIDSSFTSGIQFESCRNSYIQNVTSTGAGLYGVSLKKKTGETQGCVNVTIDKLNSFSPGASGIWINQSEYCKISNCVLEGKVTVNSQNGIRLWSSTNCIISNNTVYNSGEANIYLSVGSYNTVIGNKIYGSNEDGINCEADNYTLITGNHISYSGTYGIDMEGDHCSVLNNEIIGSSQQTNATYSGIEIGSSHCTISNNLFWKGTASNKPSYGIRYIVGSNNNMTEGNDCYEAGVTGDIQNDGGTNVRRRNNIGLTGAWKDLLITGYEVEMSTNKLLGRTTASQGAIEEIAVTTNLSFASGTLKFDSSSSATGYHTQPYNDLRYLQSYTETDAIALAKTITETQGSGILITGTATQALSTNPSWTFKVDTSLIATQYYVNNAILGTVITASNGLNRTVNDIALGGTTFSGADADLSRDTYIDANGHKFSISQISNSESALSINQGGTAYGITLASTTNGILLTATGTGISTQSTNGSAIVAFTTGSGTPGSFLKITSTTNAVQQVMNFTTTLSSGTAANGIGTSIGFSADASTGSTPLMGTLSYKWTNATYASRGSQAFIKGVNNTVDEIFANFQTGGIVIVNDGADTLATKAYARGSGGGGGGGSGTVNTGAANTLAYYPGAGTTVDDLPAITANRVLLSDASGLPVASTVTNTTLAFLDATSSIQTQLNAKQSTTLADGTFLVGNVSNVATAVTPTGDVTFNNAGLFAIASGVIVNGDINASAAIAYSKLNLATSIVNGDVSASAAIAYSKLNLTGAILNADLAGSIAYSKLSLTGAILNADLAGSIAYSKLSLTGAILNADLAGSINATKINTGVVDNTEFNYLDGVTSGIQAQLNSTQPLATAVTGLTAAGTNQGTALVLSGNNSVQEITTAASGTGVQLPVATTASKITVVNRGANAIIVYPATSGIINGQSANLGYTLPVNGVMTFMGKSSTSWYATNSFQNGDVNTTDASGALVIGAGKVTNAMLAGSISNANLANSTVTVNGTSIALGASGTVTAAAGTLTGTVLNSTVVTSSLTSVGTLTSLTMGGTLAMSTNSITMTGSIGATGARVTKGWFTDGEFTNMPTVGGTSLSSTFSPIAGSSSIVTTGTITSGTWNGTAITVANGGTGRQTSTTAYGLIAAGTTATGAHQTLAAGATTEILVGGGASALPVWTTATGTGAPVRATSPTLVTPALGTPTALVLTNATGMPNLNKAYSMAAPTASETVDMWYTAAAITITEVRELLRGSSPSVTYTINYGSSPGSATNTIVASHAATSTTGTAATLNITSIPAGSYIWMTTSATSGTVNNFHYTITYTQ